VINFTPGLLYSQEGIPVPLKQENEWGPEPVWTILKKRKIFYPVWISNIGQSKQFL
jgi:hypothetical protein